MTYISAATHKVLDQIIQLEGGFTPVKKGDHMTLFGVTDAVWARQTHQSREQAHLEMQEIGRLCEPYSKAGAQPSHGMPHQSHARADKGLSAKQRARFNAGYEKAIGILFNESLETPGFDKYPAFIQMHILDFSINKGPSRARWALVEAMHQTHLLPEAVYKNHVPVHLTAEQTLKDELFRNHGPATWYGGHNADALLMPYLTHLSPTQQDALITSYNQERKAYYSARAKSDPTMTAHLKGWNDRSDQITALSLKLVSGPTAAAPDTHSAPTATTKIGSPAPTHKAPPPPVPVVKPESVKPPESESIFHKAWNGITNLFPHHDADKKPGADGVSPPSVNGPGSIPLKAWGDAKHLKPLTIVIDPGHGYKQPWYDCGTLTVTPDYYRGEIDSLPWSSDQKNALRKTFETKHYESDITMQEAKALRDNLVKRGYKVVLTRDDNFTSADKPDNRKVPDFKRQTAGLEHRVDIAKELGNRGENVLFVSLHVDGSESEQDYLTASHNFKRVLTGHGKHKKSKEIDVITWTKHSRELHHDSQGIHIYSRTQDEQSVAFGQMIAAQFNNESGTDRDNKRNDDKAQVNPHPRNYEVNRKLYEVNIPSVLVEMGNITNLQDFIRMTDFTAPGQHPTLPPEKQNIAKQIADAVQQFDMAQKYAERSAGKNPERATAYNEPPPQEKHRPKGRHHRH